MTVTTEADAWLPFPKHDDAPRNTKGACLIIICEAVESFF